MAVKFRIMDENEMLSVKWPVRVDVPADGGFISTEFTAYFIILDADQMDAIIADDPAHAAENVLKKVWIGWEGVEGDEKFSTEARDRMLKFYFITLAVFREYNDCLLGRAVKN